MPPLTLAALISSALSVIEQEADAPWHSHRPSIQDQAGYHPACVYSPSLSNDGNAFRNDAVILPSSRIRYGLNPVHGLGAVMGTKLVACRKDGASLGDEHPAMPAPDHLGGPGFALG